MRYEVHYPEEPEGPVWEANGTKWVPSEEWHRDNETSCDGLSWKEAVAAYGPFTGTPPTPKAWNDVHKGGLYWVEAFRQGDEDLLRALAYATSPNTLVAMASDRPISITPMQDNWELISIEPMIAMTTSHAAGLLTRCPDHYRIMVEGRLYRDGQLNWRLLDMSKAHV
jgi:hypothetical protein